MDEPAKKLAHGEKKGGGHRREPRLGPLYQGPQKSEPMGKKGPHATRMVAGGLKGKGKSQHSVLPKQKPNGKSQPKEGLGKNAV